MLNATEGKYFRASVLLAFCNQGTVCQIFLQDIFPLSQYKISEGKKLQR